MPSVIWIDDAAEFMLAPLARMMGRRGWDVTVFTSYDEATAGLDRLAEKTRCSGEAFPDVICDLVIPRSGHGAFDSFDTGFGIIEKVACLGARRLVIFSVTGMAQICHQLARVEAEYPGTKFFVLEKTSGGPRELVDALVTYLTPLA